MGSFPRTDKDPFLLCKHFLFFQYICIDVGHAGENALKSFLELAMNVYEKVFGFPCVCTHRTIQFGDFMGSLGS